MAQAILSLYEDRGRASAMGAMARRKAQGLFTAQRFAFEMQEVFDTLLKTKGLRGDPGCAKEHVGKRNIGIGS